MHALCDKISGSSNFIFFPSFNERYIDDVVISIEDVPKFHKGGVVIFPVMPITNDDFVGEGRKGTG